MKRPTLNLPPRDESHRYRFRGQISPKDANRTPILNSAEIKAEDGVATMRIYDPIDSWGGDWGVSAKEFGAALDLIGDVSEIRLHLNSPGGEVFEAVAITNLLRAHPARVVATVDGIAASAASFIAASADELIMARNTELMIHDAWGIMIGNAADMRDMAGVLDRLSNDIAAIYAEKSGTPAAGWREVMVSETWFSADEAVEAGLADRVDRPAEQPSDKFDMSLFQHAGRADAPPPSFPITEEKPADQAYAARFRHRQAAARHGL